MIADSAICPTGGLVGVQFPSAMHVINQYHSPQSFIAKEGEAANN